MGEAVVNVLVLAPLEDGGGTWRYWSLALGALGGVGLALWRRRWAVVMVWATVVALVLLTASPRGWWWALVGGWWRDESRYLGLLTMLAGVLAASTAECVVAWCWRQRRSGACLTRAAAGAASVVMVTVMCLTGVTAATDTEVWARRGYDASALVHVPWVVPEETRFMQEVATILPVDAVVYGHPASGADLFPVIAGVDSRHRVPSSRGVPSDERYLASHFSDILVDPEVCQIVRARGGTPLYYRDSLVPVEALSPDFSGYTHVGTSRGFTLLASQGASSLWFISTCG